MPRDSSTPSQLIPTIAAPQELAQRLVTMVRPARAQSPSIGFRHLTSAMGCSSGRNARKKYRSFVELHVASAQRTDGPCVPPFCRCRRQWMQRGSSLLMQLLGTVPRVFGSSPFDNVYTQSSNKLSGAHRFRQTINSTILQGGAVDGTAALWGPDAVVAVTRRVAPFSIWNARSLQPC